MAGTIVETLSRFSAEATYACLPQAVATESKRVLLDSIGCALGGHSHPKGTIGIDFARQTQGDGDATIIGSNRTSSVFGAAFANAELTSALDFCSVLPPGHVATVVIPIALAHGEHASASGAELLTAVSVGNEISCRIALAMDGLRDIVDGEIVQRPVVGYSSITFGAVATAARLMALDFDVTASALGIAGSTAPVHSQGAWNAHAPSTTIKYMLAGGYAHSALTAAQLALLGHSGDIRILDDPDFGYPKFIGTTRWAPEGITGALGDDWRYPDFQSYKPYPHCRTLHPMIDVVRELTEVHDIKPEEIEHIRAWGESWNRQPTWLNRQINNVTDAQTSMAHGLALAAHRIPPTKRWQDPEVVFDESVLALMDRVTTDVHPEYLDYLAENPASRPARVEISARGTTFAGERRFPRGGPSPDPSTTLETDELIAKFRTNADGVLSASVAEEVIDMILRLEDLDNVSRLTGLLRP